MIEVRDRLTERINRARLAIEVRRSLRPLAVIGLGAAFGLACWGFILGHVTEGLFSKKHQVRFTVTDASAVVTGQHEVRLKGIKVGRITSVELVDGKPVLTTQVGAKYGRVYRDARAELRPATALENMYLDIVDRGTEKAGIASADEPLAARQTTASEQIEKVLQTFGPDERIHLAAMLRDLGGGLKGRGDELRASFAKIVPFVHVTARLARVLADRAAQTRRLVHNFSVLTGELGRRDGQLRTLVGEGGTTLKTLAHGSADLDATLRALPPTMSGIDSSFAAVRGVLPDVDAALKGLGPVADRLPSGLSALRALSKDAAPALRTLRPSVQRLVPLSESLRPLSADLSRATTALLPQVSAIDHTTRSVADCTLAVYGFFQWTASVVKFHDARGLFPRGDAAVSVNSASDAAREPNTHPAKGCSPGTPKLATG